jgi:N-acetyl-gamma-glutamyl-phosphate reductase
MVKVFIDGSHGTTGLRIKERLRPRDDIELIMLDFEMRRDDNARKACYKEADIVIMCLPDEVAVEAAVNFAGKDTVLIDTSTAHRTDASWTYGMPELAGQKERIASSKRISNPGCHASGFVALVKPLIDKGIIPADLKLSCTSLTGYSGGGKKMIAEYESSDRLEDGGSVRGIGLDLLKGPRLYGLGQEHKHLKEMKVMSGLEIAPAFAPVVADFYSGMETIVPLFRSDISGSMADIAAIYKEYYSGPVVYFNDEAGAGEDGKLSSVYMADRDDMELSVHGNDERILLTARFDNLGKGASGAAVQNLNIVLGVDETKGLNIGGDR